MTLEAELKEARKHVVTDGYEMSIGEVATLYERKELIINPDFQRLFRWDASRKTRFVESILLSIPIPPIFVFQKEDGVWELVDGLQRLSTLLQLMGMLVDADGKSVEPLILDGTNYLPSLANCAWDASTGVHVLTPAQQIDIKRARIRIEILKRESDPLSKFELFQRLNTGGAALSEQEVRNCSITMLNTKFADFLNELATHASFVSSTGITETAIEQQFDRELVLRWLGARKNPYQSGIDVHEWLNQTALKLAKDPKFPTKAERKTFTDTFDLLDTSFDGTAFGRWNGKMFERKFLLSVFEVLAVGVSLNLQAILELTPVKQKKHILSRAKNLVENPVFKKYSGAGVRGTTRLEHLLPLGKILFKP